MEKVEAITSAEANALAMCNRASKKSILHLSYLPKRGSRHYSENRYNICRIETNDGIQNFQVVREEFYDYLVENYHNQPILMLIKKRQK